MAEPVDHRVVDVDMDVDPVAVTAPDVDDRVQGAVGDLDQRVGFGRAVLSRWNRASWASRRAVSNTAPWSASSSPRSSQRPSSRCHNDTNSTGSTTPAVAHHRRCRHPDRRRGPDRGRSRTSASPAAAASPSPTWRTHTARHQPNTVLWPRSARPDPTTTHRRRTRRTSPATHPAAGPPPPTGGHARRTARLSTTTSAPARRSPTSATHPCPTLRRRAAPVVRRARCGDRTGRRGGPPAVPASPSPSPYRTHVRSTTQPEIREISTDSGAHAPSTSMTFDPGRSRTPVWSHGTRQAGSGLLPSGSTQEVPVMVSMQAVNEFLAQRHIAVVGVSDVKGSFAKTVYRELRSHGYDVVPVNPIGDERRRRSLLPRPRIGARCHRRRARDGESRHLGVVVRDCAARWDPARLAVQGPRWPRCRVRRSGPDRSRARHEPRRGCVSADVPRHARRGSTACTGSCVAATAASTFNRRHDPATARLTPAVSRSLRRRPREPRRRSSPSGVETTARPRARASAWRSTARPRSDRRGTSRHRSRPCAPTRRG